MFYAVLVNRRLADEILTKTFFFVEQCLNAHPISSFSPEATDLEAPTPSHFLVGAASSTLPSHFSLEIDHQKRYVRAQA